jgi:diaminohydroxyphosphoribosylaminopyrimidine deaminase/5-amino-6-(5-phosphoribosylamino)uracil reductase
MTRDRPFVQLKIAVSGDGLIAPGDGEPRWVTGPEARQYAHILRARADAILVGRKTVADDNPDLTCRLPGLEARSPRRVILDAGFRTAPTARMLQTAERVPVTIFGDTRSAAPAYPKGVEVRRMPAGPDGRLSLQVALESLGAEGVTRVLVEGGPTIASAFLAADLVDELVIGRGSEMLGAAGRLPVGDRGLEFLNQAESWQKVEDRKIGADRLSVYRRTGRFVQESSA